ncbi:hypothetical protein AMECASPLE_019847 [Ameca splendens]|uniref:Uncharacterized protein n=1 Tax=Ameca splendens TaxID=208324 RepID=A0ABV1AA01_9TELE
MPDCRGTPRKTIKSSDFTLSNERLVKMHRQGLAARIPSMFATAVTQDPHFICINQNTWLTSWWDALKGMTAE